MTGSVEWALTTAIVLAAPTLAVAAPERAAKVSERSGVSSVGLRPREQATLRAIRSSAGAPGAVMMLANGTTVRSGVSGVSNRATRAPMRVGLRFRVASISKTFLAAVVLQLVAEERLSLEDTVQRWLPGRLLTGARITVRDLLEHTSGVVDGTSELASPGSFEYANENYVLLGAIVEAAAGLSFHDAESLRIFRPLHLTRTLWPTTPRVPQLAHGYWSFTGSDATAIDPATLTAAGGLVSTADDVRRFFRALFDGTLLPSAQVAAMQTAVPVAGRYRGIYDGYGLGIMLLNTPCGAVWGHRGRAQGYTSFAFASPDGTRSVVVLLNVGGADDAFVVRVQELALAALCGIDRR